VTVPNIKRVIARVTVDDLDQALPLYQGLTGVTEPQRFGFRDVELAAVGPFLLLSGPGAAAYSDRAATLMVGDLGLAIAELLRAGGTIVEGPAPSPGGTRLIARHPDGAVFEYIETGGADAAGAQ
jgi:predicted enzyme related to lactoylglutathione lyase